jgi:hypothetical protein
VTLHDSTFATPNKINVGAGFEVWSAIGLTNCTGGDIAGNRFAGTWCSEDRLVR